MHPGVIGALLVLLICMEVCYDLLAVCACLSDALPNLLCAAIGDSFWRPAVIGDFTQADARGYLEDFLGVGRLAEEDWAKVYEVRV